VGRTQQPNYPANNCLFSGRKGQAINLESLNASAFAQRARKAVSSGTSRGPSKAQNRISGGQKGNYRVLKAPDDGERTVWAPWSDVSANANTTMASEYLRRFECPAKLRSVGVSRACGPRINLASRLQIAASERFRRKAAHARRQLWTRVDADSQ